METKQKIETRMQDFDAVKTFRTIKDKISKDIWGLSYEDMMNYFKTTKKQAVQAS